MSAEFPLEVQLRLIPVEVLIAKRELALWRREMSVIKHTENRKFKIVE